MADAVTPNYGLIMPEVSASNDTWGTKLNENMVDIDSLIKSLSDTINANKLLLDDPWYSVPLGMILGLDMGLAAFTPPPRDKTYRYLLLSAGATGSGQYNEGIVTGEAVSGAWPVVNATGVVNLAGSPFNGLTIRMINTERRFIRPGSPGSFQDSAFTSHNHSGNTADSGYHDHELTSEVWSNQASAGGSNYVQPSGSGYFNNNIGGRRVFGAGSHSHSFNTSFSGAEETRPRNFGVNFYIRIK